MFSTNHQNIPWYELYFVLVPILFCVVIKRNLHALNTEMEDALMS